MQLDEKHFPSSVFAVSLLVISLFNICAQYLFQWIPEFFPTEVGIASLTLALPYVIKYILLEQEKLAKPILKSINIEEDFLKWLKPTQKDWIKCIFLGFLIAFLGLITVQQDIFGLPWTIFLLKILFQIWLFIFLLGYGIVIGLYFFSLKSVIKIDKIFNCDDSYSTIFCWPIKEVKLIYSSYLRLIIIAAFLYIVAVVSLWLSPVGGFLALHTIIGRIWVMPPAIIILVYFLLFSLKILSFLPRWRSNSIDQINATLKAESVEYFKECSNKSAENINTLLNWRNLIQLEDIKVVDWKQILTVISIILAPTIRVLFSPEVAEIIRELVK